MCHWLILPYYILWAAPWDHRIHSAHKQATKLRILLYISILTFINLSFTAECDKKEMNCLDVTPFSESDKIETKLY